MGSCKAKRITERNFNGRLRSALPLYCWGMCGKLIEAPPFWSKPKNPGSLVLKVYCDPCKERLGV